MQPVGSLHVDSGSGDVKRRRHDYERVAEGRLGVAGMDRRRA